MSEFESRTYLDVGPSEYIDACSQRDKERLVDILESEGLIQPESKTLSGVRNPNINDQIFWDSLQTLTRCRHLLSVEEEEYINKLGEKLKHLG
jgi:hypothetical protein